MAKDKEKRVLSEVKNPFKIFYIYTAILAAMITVEIIMSVYTYYTFSKYIIAFQVFTIFLTLFIILMISNFVRLNKEKIALGTLFGRLKSEKWSNLEKVYIMPLIPQRLPIGIFKRKREFVILKFSGSKENISELLYEVTHTPHIIAIMLTKRSRKILLQFLPEQFKECI